MLKGALRRISTMKTVTLGKVDKVESEASYPKLSILKKVFLTLNVKMKKVIKSVRVSKGTAVKWAALIIKRVKF